MKWANFIKNISTDYKFNRPATEATITKIEDMFQVKLPDELRNILFETNGIEYSEFNLPLVWNTDRVQKENYKMRNEKFFKEMYMPFDSLLFIADAGNGDLFGYRVLNGLINNYDIYIWNHENDSRTWVAPNLQIFIERWYKGKISI
ncbi:SMI1/KNR4 family protein [Bacillus cereus group sp. RP32]|uniref:SMI1/KNR4 family protein n=1 Tax=Bacillus cereus group sp. RP32 TaxID=3040258 RepID=UPI0033990234